MTLRKFLNFSMPQFLISKMGIITIALPRFVVQIKRIDTWRRECFHGFQEPGHLRGSGEASGSLAQTCPDWPGSSSQPEQRPTLHTALLSLSQLTNRKILAGLPGCPAPPPRPWVWPQPSPPPGCGELGWCFLLPQTTVHHKLSCGELPGTFIVMESGGESSLLSCLVNKTLGPCVGSRDAWERKGQDKKGEPAPSENIWKAPPVSFCFCYQTYFENVQS